MSSVLAESRHYRLTHEPERALVRWTRSAIPFDSLDDFEDMSRATALALVRIDRAKHAMLIDLREAPLRNDPDFEEIAKRFRRNLHRDFVRTAVLVRTRAGALQIARHARESPSEAREHPTFFEETEALAFLSAAPR